MIGRTTYHYRRRLRGGLRATYYREFIRQRVLRTEPVTATDDPTCEIHVLTSAYDWLDLVWALKSFYCASGRRYKLCIHDDGTLPPGAVTQLRRHFPAARIVLRAEADTTVLPSLSNYPLCREFRRTNHLSPKIFDFAHYLAAERMLLLDSDVLFFREPTELLRRIEDPGYVLNTVNGDVASAYTVEPVAAKERAGVDLIPRFNSGLGLIHKASLRLDWLEEFLALPGILGHFWRIEQTLFALCSGRFGCELLPPEYDVKLDGQAVGPCRHYVGAVRQELYREGIARLVRGGFLRKGREFGI